MSSSKYIGHIGGVAVALGLGAALTTGTGIAWAGTPDSEQSSSTVEHKLRARLSEARESLSNRYSADDADRATKPRRLVPDAGLARAKEARAKELSEAAQEVSEKAEKVSGEIRDTITDRIKRTVTGKVFGRDPESDPEFEPTTEPNLEPTPEPAVVIHNAGALARPKGEQLTPLTALADRLPSLKVSSTDVKAAVQAAVEGTSHTGTRAIEAVAAARETFAAPAITDIRSAIAPTTTQFTIQTLNTQAEAPKAPAVVSSLLAAVGLAPLAANSPLAPTPPPALLALMAWARREFEKTINPTGAVVQTAALVEPTAALDVDPNLQTPKPPAPVVGLTEKLPWVTGPLITTADYGEPGNYGIAGTDLGIMWDDGDGNILMIFGDTFDQTGMQGVWRSNVLLRTIDTDLSNGIQIKDAVISPDGIYSQNTWSSNYGATQVIRDPGFLGLFGSTTTIIPTAAISVTENGKTTQYVNVMSVRTWDTPGRWTTNWSAIAYSEDGGKTWTVDPNTVRSSGWLRSSTPYVPGNNNFQQGAFVMGQEDDVNAEGERYVYSFGTPSGRGGSAYVSRVPQGEIRNLAAYEYWGGDERGWVANDPSAAVPVIGATDTQPQQTGILGWIQKTITDIMGGFVVGGSGGDVSEISVQYNEYLDKYVVLYTDGGNNVVMRVSDSPQGTWSDPTVLVENNPNPLDPDFNTGMYAPMIHPWSGTGALGDENYLYYNLSYWDEYNVRTMRTDLSPMGPAANSTSGTIAV